MERFFSHTIWVFCGIFTVIAIGDTKIRLDNYRVYSISVQTKDQLEALQALENDPDGLMYLEVPHLGRAAELLVPPNKISEMHKLLKSLKLKFYVKTRNIQQFIDTEQRRNYQPGYGWTHYYTVTEIYGWLDDLLEKYPNVLTDFTIGSSFENRTIRAIKLSHKPGNPKIFVESLIHAREWITVATSTYLLNELLTSNDQFFLDAAKNFDWIFVPIFNIDGYAYSHEKHRLWRKTRQPHSQYCFGVDPNRNFDIGFGGPGASRLPCSEAYSGPRAFSEPEAKAVADFIETFDNIKLYLSFHSYSQYILYPYAYTKEISTNHKDLTQIALKTSDAIGQRYDTDYRFGTASVALYPASGTSTDWVFALRNVSLVYTFELRDRGYFGFILPSEQIIPNCLEIMDGLKAMINEAKNLKYL